MVSFYAYIKDARLVKKEREVVAKIFIFSV